MRLVSRLWMGHVSDSMDEMWFDMMHATCFDIVNETRYDSVHEIGMFEIMDEPCLR